ncbi:MAG: hypothetical protein F4X94_01500 [Dehalococcoidia bacterium]|nr:hypothetical protein [Dehalococcoidia bacterium]
MSITQEEFEAILADETKEIDGDIFWRNDPDHSQSQVFRSEVYSSYEHSMFIQGRYIPASGKLTYAIIHRSAGRIYGLDLGTDHKNPGGARIGEKHKNYWREGDQDNWAYLPEDITAPWDRPVEVWRQFCDEANLRHSGIMYDPEI